MKRWFVFCVALLAAASAPLAHAHKPSDSYLSLTVEGERINGQWDIALRDLDFALGLDANQDDAITWGEVKAKQADIAAYAMSRLRLGPAGAPCPMQVDEQLIDNHSDGAYAVLRFTAVCAAAPKTLAVGYQLFFDLDPQHRGLIRLRMHRARRAPASSARPGRSRTSRSPSFRRGNSSSTTAKKASGTSGRASTTSCSCCRCCCRRCWCAPGRLGGDGKPRTSFRAALLDVVKVVTAFTVAHSITLSLAALGVVSLPSRWVESAIALSVVLAALNNIWPIVFERRWVDRVLLRPDPRLRLRVGAGRSRTARRNRC